MPFDKALLEYLQLAGGEDPLYVARRLVRFASEDVGLAATIGNSNAQLKNRRPGNSWTATIHASDTPTTAVPSATPATSKTVLTSASGST